MDAIHSALSQTYANIEVVVSDNQSTDDTWEHLSSISDPRFRAIRQNCDIGMVGNFNAVLQAASGNLFLLLSDDDLLDPEMVEELTLPFLRSIHGLEPSSVGMSWCPCVVIDAEGAQMWQTAMGPNFESSIDFIQGLWLGYRGPRLASVIVRTADARIVGGYDFLKFGAVCDTGNWAQITVRYPNVVCIRNAYVKYRVHQSSGTSTAACREWQTWGANLHSALLGEVSKRGTRKEIRSIEILRKPLLANLTVDVLMRGIGKPGWVVSMAREFWRSRRFMLTPYVTKRILKDGWKLLRVKK